ncbi:MULTISPECIES: transposase domain-containing protein [Citrobacter freundii complex]|uniref:transposase domain-containing protein n=1 Tax=Citrobacter freundii complex TaxID=1344959 RepID=UPI000778E7BA|nr:MULTISPECIES: transposase domain-containing protein [Citrobacter freundii complex]EIA0558308.1 Mu transposase C-terminal domain-containing protein [Escherichia coli]EKN0239155.1 Mu transposase C-terminal domain-containing protein [Citrobacter freundii]ELS5369035.1 Mu transposase C-terminal domain-containing protein [Citrobacter freundii]KYC16256.1 transposase [Citrobacter sp. AATXR]MDT9777910.1 transposase domain-containing protein [Citrobacter freundii]
MEFWVSVKECVGVCGFPQAESNARKKLEDLVCGRSELRRKRAGTKAFEYHISVLPPEVRAELLATRGLIETSSGLITLPQEPERVAADDLDRQRLWSAWEKATGEQRLHAERRTKAAALVAELMASGVGNRKAITLAAKQLQISEGTLRNLYYKVKDFSPDLWGPVLLDRRVREKRVTGRSAEISDDAWQFFLGDYLRNEAPFFSKCYERLEIAAETHGWTIPAERTLRRKLEREVDPRIVVATREGENALAQMHPSQQRTVAQLHAMEWINGDGYQHNVFVRWFNGEIIRPKTWFWQDVHSRKIVGWRADVSENSDSIRLSLMDTLKTYGKPQHITIDNTRAAANKWLSGGVPNRYRFKVREDDPMGIIPLLGIKLHWTGVIGGKGWGQAKPVERAFGVGGLGEYIDKHPALAGAFAGENVSSKPENYGSRAVDVETFMEIISEGVAMFNRKTQRKTEMCRGELSFDQAFEQSYSQAVITRLTEEQIRQFMLPAESVRVKPTGEFTMESGGSLFGRKNTYWSEQLVSHRSRKITVRFDPRNLHSEVACYDLDGRFLCMAECRAAVAFGDTEAGREHNRARREMMRSTKKAAKALNRMTAIEVNDLLPKTEHAELPERHVVERVFNMGNTVRRVEEIQDTQTENDVIFQTFVNKAKQSQK